MPQMWIPSGEYTMNNELRDERAKETRYGMTWNWLTKTGKRVGFDVTRMASLPGRGAVIGIDTPAGNLQVYLSEGGRSLRAWNEGGEMGSTHV